MNKQIIYTLLCALLSMSVLNAQVTKKVPKGYKAVDARISSPSVESGLKSGFLLKQDSGLVLSNGEVYHDIEHRMISNLKIWKNTAKGTILLRFKGKKSGIWNQRYLIRLFDKNGEYLSHFVSDRIVEIFGMPTTAKDTELNKDEPVVERELVYSVNIRDLRDTEIICLSLTVDK